MNFSDSLIRYNPNPIFLEVTFNEYINFRTPTDNLDDRAHKIPGPIYQGFTVHIFSPSRLYRFHATKLIR